MVVHLNWQLVINPSHGNKDLISYQIFFYSRSRRPSAHHCIHNPQHLLTDLPFTTSRQLPYLPLLNLPLTVALRHTDLLLLNLLLLNLLLLNLLLTGSAFTTFLLLLNLLMAALKLTGTTLPGLPVSVSLLPSAPLQELRSGHLRELRSGHLRELQSCPSAPGHLLPLSSFIEFIFYYLGIGSFFCSDAGLTTIVARLNKLPFCSYRVSVAESFFPTTANLISALGYLGSS